MKWIVPSERAFECTDGIRSSEELPRLVLSFRKCKLVFEARPSEIPAAGTGLFVACIEGPDLNLPPGDMLDLGTYVPLLKSDLKRQHVCLLKNLLYEWQIKTWSFSTTDAVGGGAKQLFLFDPTEDFTGKLHKKAKRNIISYANENKGTEEIASISAAYDPEGNLHYLLGYKGSVEETLTIPAGGTWRELLVRVTICM